LDRGCGLAAAGGHETRPYPLPGRSKVTPHSCPMAGRSEHNPGSLAQHWR